MSGESPMRLVVGLGNPGPKYAGTRHNFGFRALDHVAAVMGVKIRQSKYNSLYTQTRYQGNPFLLVKPLTFMNLSGSAVRSWVEFYHLNLSDILVIYDDIALDLGRIRLRDSGSAGGHNGIKSLIQHLGSDAFPRLKLGIGPQPEGMDSADYVLHTFRPSEWDTADLVIRHTPDIVVCWSHEGLTQAMNRFNSWTATP